MIASITTFIDLGLERPSTSRASASPAIMPEPLVESRARRQSPELATSAVALAPATMTALIQAQAEVAANQPASKRLSTARTLDHLISEWQDAAPKGPAGVAPPALRRLEAARALLI